MIFLMLISFYTSRVILQKLGVEDFGIYNLVGSVIAMFSSMKTIFSASTQRFLNYEMGKKCTDKLNDIFNTSIIVNIIISIVFFIIVESVGMWYINHYINIADNRILAAKYVFHFSVITAIIGILTTSLDAEIIAHEKMNFYAYLSVAEGVLKLSVAYLISAFDYDRLILYAIFLFGVSVIILIIESLYCRICFSECRIKIHCNKTYLKEMTQFAGWNFLGTNAYVLSQGGQNMILNYFGGPIVNAARGIAYQVNGAINQFINNIVIVINPYCVKTYASGDKQKSFEAIYFSSKLLFFLQSAISVPIIIFTKEILSIWLSETPDYSVLFLQLVLIYSLIRTLHPGIDILLKANGDIKYYQIIEGVLLLLPLIATFYSLKAGYPYYSAFIILIIFDILNLIMILLLCVKETGLSLKSYLIRVFTPCTLVLVLLLSIWYFSHLDSILMRFVCFIIMEFLILIIGLVSLTKYEKNLFRSILKRK